MRRKIRYGKRRPGQDAAERSGAKKRHLPLSTIKYAEFPLSIQ
jgi:hypothetical protein